MGGRYDVTTDHLRDATCTLLLERGARAFSLDALAKAAFVSVGAVYERWGSSAEAVADVVRTRVVPELEGIANRRAAGEDPFALLLEDEHGERALRLAVETLFAARDEPSLQPDAQHVIEAVSDVIGGSNSAVDTALLPYVTVIVIGFGLLDIGGCRMPPMAGILDELLTADQSRSAAARIDRIVDTPASVPIVPPLGDVKTVDSTGDALRTSTRALLESTDSRGASARSIASHAGVTTGAIYRRFESTSTLLTDVLMSELQAHRYAWMADLIDALGSTDPLGNASVVMAQALSRAIVDSPTNRMLLEITVKARTDEAVRAKLVGQVESVAASRIPVFEHLARAGVIRADLDAGAFAWLLQAAPVGGRLMGAIGLQPETSSLQAGIGHITALATTVEDDRA